MHAGLQTIAMAKELSARRKQQRWDRHFLQLALAHARMSKDPSTKVGAIIVGPARELVSAGFNGFPRHVDDTPERLADRDTKLELIVHAEMNAVLAAARAGIRLKGCTMYVAASDASGRVWGGCPCIRCTVEVIQAGIAEVVSWPMKTAPSRWHDSLAKAKAILAEADIFYREVEPEERLPTVTIDQWAAELALDLVEREGAARHLGLRAHLRHAIGEKPAETLGSEAE
jgi:dCMP deaminase